MLLFWMFVSNLRKLAWGGGIRYQFLNLWIVSDVWVIGLLKLLCDWLCRFWLEFVRYSLSMGIGGINFGFSVLSLRYFV